MSLEAVLEKYTPTIGIECHVQLKTRTKLFSGADNDARDAAPNTTVSPICFGFPGVLPVLNEGAVELSIRAGLALSAEIASTSRFERKHYFYPDLPKGYQITQLAEPVIVGGSVEALMPDGSSKIVRIHHAHLEEDAGKLTHPVGADYSLVDLNRAGTPLIEIVSEADMHSAVEAKAYAQALYRLMTFSGVTEGNLFHGNMRFDVNVSIAPREAATLGTRTETKNLNSFRSIEKAAEYEIMRQATLLDRGEAVIQETRGWNEAKQKTFSQRSKEDAHDYRYFPDADIPPLHISQAQIDAVAAGMPPMPKDYLESWKSLDIDETVQNALLSSSSQSKIVYDLQKHQGNKVARRVAHWFATCSGDIETDAAQLVDAGVDEHSYVELSGMIDDALLKSSDARLVFAEMLKTGESPTRIADEKGMLQSNDLTEIENIVDEILADPASQKAINDIKSGNEKAAGYLVGQAMKRSQGKANPALLQKMIHEKLM